MVNGLYNGIFRWKTSCQVEKNPLVLVKHGASVCQSWVVRVVLCIKKVVWISPKLLLRRSVELGWLLPFARESSLFLFSASLEPKAAGAMCVVRAYH